MARINELPSISTASDSSYMLVADDVESYKITVSDLKATLVPRASTVTSGTVKVGTGLTINEAGVLSVTNYSGYVLPRATNAVLGGVIVGSGLAIDNNGVLSVNELTIPPATKFTFGTVKIGDGLSITNGVLSNALQEYVLPTASQTELGGVKVGQGLAVNNSVLSVVPVKVFGVEDNQLIDTNYTIPDNKTFYSVGTISVDRNVTVTVSGTSTWTIYTPGASSSPSTETTNLPVITEQDRLITANYSIANNKTASSIGPIEIDRGVTVEIAPLSTWIIF